MPDGIDPPRWQLGSIYPSFDSPEYQRDLELLEERIGELLAALEKPLPDTPEDLGGAALYLIHRYERAGARAENLKAYAEAVYTTDTRDPRALRELNALERRALPLVKGAALFRNRLAERRDLLLDLLETDETLKPYGFFIRESLERARFQMAPELEDLAGDLARSGGDAWERLHGAISSTAWGLYEAAPDRRERKTVIALRDLAHSPDRGVRERAYRAELAAWRSVEIPLAAALNGVKGTALTLDRRRGWIADFPDPGLSAGAATALGKSAFQSRITGRTLEALIAALEEALPLFRRYLRAKARLLDLPVCGFYDLFAPLDAAGTWTWKAAADYIIQRFTSFDSSMGIFARHAFALSWIDGECREGKVGGAYCVSFPLTGESRVLCNFEGSFDSVTTLAHELGHGWHHELIKDLPRSLAQYPMTLAETASIFAETIVFEGALGQKTGRGDRAERLGLIEGNLKDSCQVMVDILSRFYFERELFQRREAGELSPGELCDMMTQAQIKTYGDALDPDLLHPYMWAVKSHYYSSHLGFYNYPYAFGLLFSLGLYARYQREGSGFAAAYRDLLRLTGQAQGEAVARHAGFDLEDPAFWQGGLGIIARRVGEFEDLAGELGPVRGGRAPADHGRGGKP